MLSFNYVYCNMQHNSNNSFAFSVLTFRNHCLFYCIPFRYPRHRKLISINKIYTGRRNKEFNLRHDWNSLLSDRPDLLFQRISRELYPNADDFPRYLSMFEKELGLKVKYGADIGKIKASEFNGNRGYILSDQNGVNYQCRYSIYMNLFLFNNIF